MRECEPVNRISDNAVAFMRLERKARNWSAQDVADGCVAFGASLDPPIPSTLTRSKIAKLENGIVANMNVDEAWLLAGAFGVSIEAVLTNSDETSSNEGAPGFVPNRTVEQRLGILEGQMHDAQRALGAIASEIWPPEQ